MFHEDICPRPAPLRAPRPSALGRPGRRRGFETGDGPEVHGESGARPSQGVVAETPTQGVVAAPERAVGSAAPTDLGLRNWGGCPTPLSLQRCPGHAGEGSLCYHTHIAQGSPRHEELKRGRGQGRLLPFGSARGSRALKFPPPPVQLPRRVGSSFSLRHQIMPLSFSCSL